jgi:hypothetical protein
LIYDKTRNSFKKCVREPEPHSAPGLPDFSSYNIPKWGEIFQMTTKDSKWIKNTPNAVKYTNIFHYEALQNVPKLGFWYENINIPSGSPAPHP